MAKQRIVNTKFWDDSYITSLDPNEKLVFLYLLTNPLTNISGVYELPLRRAAFDIGLDQVTVEGVLKKFESDKKLLYRKGWVGIRNFIRHQTLNPKVKQGILLELKKAPKEILDQMNIDYHSLSIGCDSLSHSNSNANKNSNFNGFDLKRASLNLPPDIARRRSEIVRKFQV